MAEVEKSTLDNNVRKLRKKLRQIENLQRLYGVRELSDEESAKVSRRGEIRAQLQDLLSIVAEEEQTMQTSEEEVSKPFEKDELGTLAKSETEQENAPEQDPKKEKQSDCDEDFFMESDNGSRGHTENREESKTKQEIHHGGNVAEDKKIEKLGKSKGSKRKIGSPSYWKETYFSVRIIKGHHHPLCAVDFNEEIVLSGGHDTSLKIWDANTYEEIFSLGGHTGRISAILLTSRSKAVTGSQDCSIRFWNTKTGHSLGTVYVYNPVTCLAYNNNGLLAIGNEGGKVDIYDVEKETMACSTRVFDDPVVSLAFIDDGELACASTDGIKKYGLGNRELIELSSIYENIESVSSLTNGSRNTGIPSTSDVNTIPLRKVNCIATFKNNIFWGDDGFNVKAHELASRTVVKLRNNLTEYSPTDAMTVLADGDNGYLFCSGFDIDRGCGYINVRQLPHMDYLGTISDDSLGHISCIAASIVDGRIKIISGGSELRVWNEASIGKKRRASDELCDIIPCKFVNSYVTARDSEEESESEDEIENETTYVASNEIENEKKSWCVVQ